MLDALVALYQVQENKMKKWNRTIMYWPRSGDDLTDIPNTKLPDEKRGFVRLGSFQATSMPNGKEGLLEISFSNFGFKTEKTERFEIITRLMKLNDIRKIKLIPYIQFDRSIKLIFTLNKKEGFTDASIILVKEIVQMFNVISRWHSSQPIDAPDNARHRQYMIANHIIHQDTWIKKKGEWIPFQTHLCQKHDLPDYYHAATSSIGNGMSLDMERFYEKLYKREDPFFAAAEL